VSDDVGKLAAQLIEIKQMLMRIDGSQRSVAELKPKRLGALSKSSFEE
jgi:hypothetical protein